MKFGNLVMNIINSWFIHDQTLDRNLGKGSVWGRGQSRLQIIRLNTLVDVIRVPKACTSGSASNYTHSSVILRKEGLKYGIRKSTSKYGKVGVN